MKSVARSSGSESCFDEIHNMNPSPQVQIRAFRPGDRQQLVGLWSDVFPNDPQRNAPHLMIDRKLHLEDNLLLVACIDSEIVGAVIAGYDGVRGWLYHLAVAPTQRRAGIGTQLVRTAEARLRALGRVKVNLQIRSSNSSVAAFYASIGYDEEPRVSMGRRLT
jgi:ribosomal protein S18 acetylase RimI-like enzyme